MHLKGTVCTKALWYWECSMFKEFKKTSVAGVQRAWGIMDVVWD